MSESERVCIVCDRVYLESVCVCVCVCVCVVCVSERERERESERGLTVFSVAW